MTMLASRRWRYARHAARARQRGVVILLFMLVAVSASAFFVLRALNTDVGRTRDRPQTSLQALRAAKEALLGYAVSYAEADGHAPSKGPGHLPRPDLVNGEAFGVAEGVGVASPHCSGPPATAKAETGLLPFRTLGLSVLSDGAGAPLWYAVSCGHRSVRSPPLNSDTPGLLVVDGTDDIVAVVIAPGAALDGQARDSAGPYGANAYLEGDNTTLDDGIYASRQSGIGNDTVITITRAELAAAVERRVLGEVAGALANYFHDPDADDLAGGIDPDCAPNPQDCDDGYPWLAPFVDPSTSEFRGQVDGFASDDTSFGHLPLVHSGVAFDADFVAAWQIMTTAAAYSASGGEPPSQSCLRDGGTCTQSYNVTYIDEFGNAQTEPVTHAFGGVTGVAGGGWEQGRCTVTGTQSVQCTAVHGFELTASSGTGSRSLRREYVFEFASNTALAAPTATALRTLEVVRSGAWTGSAGKLTVTDRELPSGTVIGSATLGFDALDPGDHVALSGVPFDLEVSTTSPPDRARSPGALPPWFVANDWHHLVMVRYARADSPGAVDADCPDDDSCLVLALARAGTALAAEIEDIGGVVISAGPGLAGMSQDRPGATVEQYLEGNNLPGSAADASWGEVSPTFNDRVLVLER